MWAVCCCVFFFFNDTATTEIYTLSLHDALPISAPHPAYGLWRMRAASCCPARRSEEHTSELQSPCNLVCRLLLEKKTNTRPRAVLPWPPKRDPPTVCYSPHGSLVLGSLFVFFFFFLNDTATTEISTLSLHDALPIYVGGNAIDSNSGIIYAQILTAAAGT